MSIFISPKVESIVQVDDQTRLTARYSYTPDEDGIASVEIQPDTGADFYTVTNDYLDWVFTASSSAATNGEATVTFRVTASTSGATPVTEEVTISVLTASVDNLFSNDADILAYEPDIYDYLRDGRRSWIDKHRAAQGLILDELAAKGYAKNDGTNFTKSDTFSDDFKKWSTFLVLETIFEELSNATDDIFAAKSNRYQSQKIMAKDRSVLSLDFDGDGTVESNEKYNITSGTIRRC